MVICMFMRLLILLVFQILFIRDVLETVLFHYNPEALGFNVD